MKFFLGRIEFSEGRLDPVAGLLRDRRDERKHIEVQIPYGLTRIIQPRESILKGQAPVFGVRIKHLECLDPEYTSRQHISNISNKTVQR